MTRSTKESDLDLYRQAIEKWMSEAEIRVPDRDLVGFDGDIIWRSAGTDIRYLVEVKRHFRHQDVGVVVDQLNRRRAKLPLNRAGDRLLLLAPHVRPQQADALERAEIDYLDLAGNVHLKAQGLFVHVEGRKPPKALIPIPSPPQKGWIKTVMAILVSPHLSEETYRVLADQADVALGTVAGCVTDLIARGLVLEASEGRRIADRQALVALWVQAYVERLRPKLKERRLQIHAASKQEIWMRLQSVLSDRSQAWALTGADLAEQQTHFYRADETEIYAPIRVVEDRQTQKALVAQPAVRGGNLLVIEPPGPLAMPRATRGALPVAPNLLAYAELCHRGTGQALEAAQLFLPRVLDSGTN